MDKHDHQGESCDASPLGADELKWDAQIRLVDEILSELNRARAAFPAMTSAHEGYAILLEEVDELWAEIKRIHPSPTNMRAEAIQVAAMAIRFIEDVIKNQ